MSNLLSTVIMKTDMRDSTPKFRSLTGPDLSALLTKHQQFILDVAAKHGGSLLKDEGDASWLAFPSVTAAALAAMSMQEELRLSQADKGENRLAIRIVITLGDILRREGGIFGEIVNLTARIESITPPDEIYLSQSAWLALNKAEIQSSFVNDFVLKGFPEPVKVYKINQQHRARLITAQSIVFTDVRGYSAFAASHPVALVEMLLEHLERFHAQVCEDYCGVIRTIAGDTFFCTFAESEMAVQAVLQLRDQWETFRRTHGVACTLGIAVHKGDLYAYRSHVFSNDTNITARMAHESRGESSDQSTILVSDRIQQELSPAVWNARLRKIASPAGFLRTTGIEIYRLD